MSVAAPTDSKKLVEALLGDLRLLSTEAKKKFNHVKEAAESGVVRVRNISTASGESSLLTNLRAASSELLHPLALACATRQTRLVQIALQGIQRLIQHRILEPGCANVVVNELWNLVDAECEELRVLQTVPPLVSADLLVTGNNLAKCIVMCFRMHFAKDPVVINAASAAVRQLVGGVFERVIQEDGVFSGDLTVVTPSGGRPSPRSAPPTLRPCAADAYMLFRDLCLLINAEPAIWLIGMREITRTLGLELLEALLKNYPGVFFKHSELGGLVKQDVCQLVIKLFSPNLKAVSSQLPNSRTAGVVPSSPDRPYFPIAMRLVRIVVILITFYHQLLPTECEIFVSHLLKFVDADKRGWQRALALEALHRIISRPEILRWMSENFDGKSSSTKLIQQIATGISAVIHQSFVQTQFSSDPENNDSELAQQSGSPGFFIRGVWVPYVEQLTSKRTLLLDSLEKHEAGVVPDGYAVSRSCCSLADMAQSTFAAVDALMQEDNSDSSSDEVVALALYNSCFGGVLSGISLLLAASTDETVTDQLLCAVSTLVAVGCKLNVTQRAERALFVLCSASLPSPGYMPRFGGIPIPASSASEPEVIFDAEVGSSFHQVVATGPPCPSPVISPELWNQQVVLTSRNLQAARVLLGVISGHAASFDELWYLSLSTCQHISWLLAMRPSPYGLFSKDKNESDSGPGNSIATVTTAALSETPVLASFLDKIMYASSSLVDDSLLTITDALIRLSDEQIAVAATGRECSLYSLGSLLRVSLLNLTRMQIFWSKATAHFIKVCGHTSSFLRDWSAVAMTTLVRQALKAKTGMNEEEQQCMCLAPLNSLCTSSAGEVRRRQLECVMAVLQTEGAQLKPSTWPTLIHIVAAVVDQENGCDEVLVRQGYLVIRLISADFLQSLPFDCVAALVEAIARYGKQLADQNISLSALALLWTISDFVFRKSETVGPDAAEKVWLVLYTCLSELCVDSRHSVRKSGCQTLLQTVAAHGHALRPSTWSHMIWQILMPLLDRVRSQTRSASTERSSSSLIMHHSRDTEQKQWTETCINILSAACKMFNAQRKVLLELDGFGAAWEALLSYLEWAACYENAELSLSALKSFQEVLLGKISAQTLDINTRDRASSQGNCDITGVDQVPSLPLAQWLESWASWQRMSRGLAKLGSAAALPQGGVVKGSYVPGPSHLTTLLQIFPPLFERVSKHISVEELRFEQLPSVMESLVNVPIPSEQAPFVLPSTTSQLTPTQEAIIDCTKSIHAECLSNNSSLREAIADQIRLLLRFASLATRINARVAPSGKNYREWALQCVIPFAETSLRLSVELFSATSSYPEVVRSLVLVDIVQFLGEPLYLKYSCISASTWKLAASALMTVLRISLPLARQQAEHFNSLWIVICETLERYLFTPNTSTRLAADERKRDELAECQAIELVRCEMLPHADRLPPAAVQRLIALLNRGSICQLDPTDVLDSHTQRAELARTCFDALLSTSNDGDGRLGLVAVSSLLQRCAQVMADFVRDWSGSGDLRLPRTRLSEMVSALQAIDSLIARLARDPSLTELYSQLVSLYPAVVDVVPCSKADPQLESQLVTTLKSYQTLLLLKAVPNFSS